VVERLGDLAGGEAEHVAEDQCGALCGWKVLDSHDERQLDALALLVAGLRRGEPLLEAQLLIRVGLHPNGFDQDFGKAVVGISCWLVVARQHPLRPPRDQLEASVGGDAVEPRPQRAAALELRQPAPGAQERVLEGVVGVVDRAEHPVAVRVELLAVELHELAEGVLVPSARCLEQLAFARGRVCVHAAARLDRAPEASRSLESIRAHRSVSLHREVITFE
jgi:hypothetical protein